METKMYISNFLERCRYIDTFYIYIYKGKDFKFNRLITDNYPLTIRIFTKNKLDILNHFTVIGTYILSEYGEPDKGCIQVVYLSYVLLIQRTWRKYLVNRVINRTNVIFEELIKTAWSPERLKWCLEYDDEYFN
jgi:hypothetical protein